MRIISWNIRGMGSTVKKRFLSKLIKERGLDMVMGRNLKLKGLKSLLFRDYGATLM